MYDLIVIGGGPAALAATYFADGRRLNALMIYEELGGKVGWLESLGGAGKETQLPGNELAQLLTRRLMAREGRIMHDSVVSIKRAGESFQVSTAQHGVLKAQAVVVATGATPLRLQVPGAERFVEHGLGYSASTHAHLLAGESVAVVGGGMRALRSAAELATTAARVYVIAPRLCGCDEQLLSALQQCSNVELLEGYEVCELRGEQRLEAVLIDGAGPAREVRVQHVFVALGVVPNSRVVAQLVETNVEGYIQVNAQHETLTPGVYAAGDVSSRYTEQVLVAIGDGARAAQSAYSYILTRRLIAA